MSSSYDDCSPTAWEDSKMGLRVGGIFVILATSVFGALLPILSRRSARFSVPQSVFAFAKYTGSGVIIATAFIHLLPPAIYALSSECLEGTWQVYPWPAAIAMFSVLALFIVEFFCVRIGNARIQAAGGTSANRHTRSHGAASDLHHKARHDVESASSDQSRTLPYRHSSTPSAIQPVESVPSADVEIELTSADVSSSKSVSRSPTEKADVEAEVEVAADTERVEDILDREARERDAWAQIIGMLILEFGIVFHSIFIGMMLATDRDFTIIFVVIVFHQAFEGLGLGARLAFLPLPARLNWVPVVMGIVYAALTPLGMAIGLAARHTYQSSASGALMATGILDSISAGILLWTNSALACASLSITWINLWTVISLVWDQSLVELMAHEFLFSPNILHQSFGTVLYAFGCMLLGCAVMSLLGKWA